MNTKGGGDASLDHIREILFGAQSRDHETQLKQVDKRISEGLKELREEMRTRHSELDQRIKEEFSTIKAKLRAEISERNDALKALTRDLAKSTSALSKSIAELDNRSTGELAAAQKSLSENLSEAATEWQQRHEELSHAVDEELEELRTGNADRSELSELFKELALRLTGELKRPAPKA